MSPPPLDPLRSPVSTRAHRILAAILGCILATVAMFALEIQNDRSIILPPRIEDEIFHVTMSALSATTNELDCQSTGNLFHLTDGSISISERGVFGPFDRLFLMAAVLIGASVAVCRAWGFGILRSAIVVVLTALMGPPLILILPGVFVGLALASSMTVASAEPKVWVARDAAILLSCAIIALIWWFASWIGDEDESPSSAPPQKNIALTTSMAVTAATALVLAAVRFAAAVGAQAPATGGGRAGDPWLSMRWAIGSGLLLASATMIIISIFRTNMVRWAWLAALAVIPLGGGISTAVPLLAAIIAGRDHRFRELRALPLGPSAPAKIARRLQTPLSPWIWVMTTVVLFGGWMRYTRGADGYGLEALAHPALFFPVCAAAAGLGVWGWIHVRRLTGRRFTSPLVAVLLMAGALALYWMGHHREVVYQRQLAAAQPYLKHVKESLAQVPSTIGPWTGTDLQWTTNDILGSVMAHPNAFLRRQYRDSSRGIQAQLFIVHWDDMRDLMQLYPPNHFPGNGFTLVSSENADWTIASKHITGTLYTFETGESNSKKTAHVAYFVIYSDGETFRNLGEITRAIRSMKPEVRVRGVAEFQVIIQDDCPPETMRQITTELVTGALPAIDAIISH